MITMGQLENMFDAATRLHELKEFFPNTGRIEERYAVLHVNPDVVLSAIDLMPTTCSVNINYTPSDEVQVEVDIWYKGACIFATGSEEYFRPELFKRGINLDAHLEE